MRLSINRVFGENLKKLSAMQASNARVAREIGVSRVQFNRYLNGESFPKPAVLKKICDLFLVDARIMTELLTDADLNTIRIRQDSRAAYGRFVTGRNLAIEDAISATVRNNDYFSNSDYFPDGVYMLWRRSFSEPARYVKLPLLVRTVGGAQIVRGYDNRLLSFYDPSLRRSRAREFRGLVLHQADGIVIQSFHQPPNQLISVLYAQRRSIANSMIFVGFSMLLRENISLLARRSNCVISHLSASDRAHHEAARQQYIIDEEEVPKQILRIIQAPMED